MSDTFATRVRSTWLEQNEVIRSTAESFKQPRQAGETDLVTECREMLINSGLIREVQAVFDTHPYICEALPLGLNAQRYLLNKFWQVQLMSLSCDTQKERFCLIDRGEAKDWIKCFREGVLPKICEYSLPVAN